MNTLRILAALLMTASAFPASAQVVAAPRAAEAKQPEFSCPCDAYDYEPLSEKGTAAQEYWDARRKAKIARGISTTVLLFAYLAQSGGAANEAAESYGKAMRALDAARARAEGLKAVKVVGEDLGEEAIEFGLKKGVDYRLKR
ncbi:MAG: hypothetical protein HY928_12400 [Elusimicrobia bacterium]|nr:hypothetical protein [Elusimicrobiota bacterium]